MGPRGMWCKRMNRKTYTFSKDWEMLARNFAHYDSCRRHRTLGIAPTMASELADRPWAVEELPESACVNR